MRYYFESQREGRFKMLDYYKGMDISFLQEYLEKGMKTYDLDGTLIDPLKLAKKHGVNAMRLRIWHTPENVPESGGYCSLERTIVMAKKIKHCHESCRFWHPDSQYYAKNNNHVP